MFFNQNNTSYDVKEPYIKAVESMGLIDQYSGSKTVLLLNRWVGLGNAGIDEQISRLQFKLSAEIQKIESSRWTPNAQSRDIVEGVSISECIAPLVSSLKSDADQSGNESLKTYANQCEYALSLLNELGSTYVECGVEFKNTCESIRKIEKELIAFLEKKAGQHYRWIEKEIRKESAECQLWESKSHAQWKQSHTVIIDTLREWCAQFDKYQVSVIAIASIDKSLLPITTVLRGIRTDFVEQRKLINRNDEKIIETFCIIAQKWIVAVTPISERLRAYRKKMIQDCEEKEKECAMMNNDEQKHRQMIDVTKKQEQKYYASIATNHENLDPQTINNHILLKKKLRELETSYQHRLNQRRKKEDKLAIIRKLHASTSIQPPDDVLLELLDKEQQLWLRDSLNKEVVQKQHERIDEHKLGLQQDLLGQMMPNLKTDILQLIQLRDKAFKECTQKIQSVADKEILSVLDNLKYLGSVAGVSEDRVSPFARCFEAIRHLFYSSLRDSIIDMVK